MNPVTVKTTARRAQRIDRVARQLLPRAGLLIRLVGRELGSHASRTEAGVLNTLDRGPRRVTELAELEGLAQPTMTQLLQKLERQGWVTRERRPEDGRFVIVSITQTGRVAL